MCTVFKVRRLLLHQAKIGFVYEGCGLQRVAGTFSAKVVMREAAEFVVDQRNQAAQALFLTGPLMKSPCTGWFRWSTANSAASRITTFAENVPATRCRPQP